MLNEQAGLLFAQVLENEHSVQLHKEDAHFFVGLEPRLAENLSSEGTGPVPLDPELNDFSVVGPPVLGQNWVLEEPVRKRAKGGP